MEERLQKLIKSAKEKEVDLADRLKLILLGMPPSSLRGKWAELKKIANYETKRWQAKKDIVERGGAEKVLEEYFEIESELAETKSQLAEYFDDYSLDELRDIVCEDDYEWLVTNKGEIIGCLKGIDG